MIPYTIESARSIACLLVEIEVGINRKCPFQTCVRLIHPSSANKVNSSCNVFHPIRQATFLIGQLTALTKFLYLMTSAISSFFSFLFSLILFFFAPPCLISINQSINQFIQWIKSSTTVKASHSINALCRHIHLIYYDDYRKSIWPPRSGIDLIRATKLFSSLLSVAVIDRDYVVI